MKVWLVADYDGKEYCKEVDIPGILPLGSTVFVEDPEDAGYGFVSIRAYAWWEGDRCIVVEVVVDESFPFVKFGWIEGHATQHFEKSDRKGMACARMYAETFTVVCPNCRKLIDSPKTGCDSWFVAVEMPTEDTVIFCHDCAESCLLQVASHIHI